MKINYNSSVSRRWRLSVPIVLLFVLLFSIDVAPSSAVEPGGPSLNELAEQAFQKNQIEKSVSLYERWLEASPSDHLSWYNYACGLALLDQQAKALNAFDNAVTAGWRDADWPLKDDDLLSIREDISFEGIIHRIEKLNSDEAESAQGKRPHYTTQKRISPYGLTLPGKHYANDNTYPLVVLLHGRTGDMHSMIDMPERLALQGVAYLFPQAPYEVGKNPGGFEYWPRAAYVDGDEEAFDESRDLLVEWLGELIEKVVEENNIDPRRVVIAGFSQGGAASLLAASADPKRYIGVGSLAGSAPWEEFSVDAFKEMGEDQIKWFIGHGLHDSGSSAGRMKEAAKMASSTGVEVTNWFYPVGHEVSDEMVADMSEWLSILFYKE